MPGLHAGLDVPADVGGERGATTPRSSTGCSRAALARPHRPALTQAAFVVVGHVAAPCDGAGQVDERVRLGAGVVTGHVDLDVGDPADGR